MVSRGLGTSGAMKRVQVGATSKLYLRFLFALAALVVCPNDIWCVVHAYARFIALVSLFQIRVFFLPILVALIHLTKLF